MIRALGLALAVMASVAASAYADDGAPPKQPPPVPLYRPVVPLDDTRSYGPTAPQYAVAAAGVSLLYGGDAVLTAVNAQLALGFPPARKPRELRELYDRYDLLDYQLRVRGAAFKDRDDWIGGPLTIAVQRYFPISQLAISPMLFAHVGIEAAVSTPWMSGRRVEIPEALQVLGGVDSELAGDGWSVRPASAYLRGDFLACRSASFDLGIEPEVFIPTDGPREYGTRFHVAGGLALGCGSSLSTMAPKVALEYRGRVRMHAGDLGAAYRDSVGVAVQFDVGSWLLQAFYRADLGTRMDDFGEFGLRVQVGKAKQPW